MAGGLVGALVSIPQSMGMGVIAFSPLGSDYAGLGLVAGLVGAVVVTACSALFGGTAGLISGPRGSVSLVFAAILGSLLASDALFEPGANREVIVLSLAMMALIFAGILQITFGLCRLGNAIKYVPYPVIAGFLNAAAILIILGQLRAVFDMPATGSIFEIWRYVDTDALIRCAFVGAIIVTIFGLPKLLPRVPGLMVGAIIGIGGYYAIVAGSGGVDMGTTLTGIQEIPLEPRPIIDLFGIIGAVWHFFFDPAGVVIFGGIRLGEESLGVIAAVLVPGAISIALLQSFDSLFSAIALDDLSRNRSDARRELIAQGTGTVLSASFGFLAGSGSIARTRLAYRVGARSAWAALASSVFILVLVLLFTPVIERIPEIIVASILFVIAIELFDKWTLGLLRSVWKNGIAAQRATGIDLAIIALVVGTGLIFGLVEAVGVGVAVSTIVFVLSVGRSPIRRSYRGNAVSSFLQRGDFSAALLREYGCRIAVLELEGPFFFGSAGKVEREVERLADDGVGHVILDLKRVNDIDSTAAQMLSRISRRMDKRGKTLLASYLMPVSLPAGDRAAAEKVNREGRRDPSVLHENWQKLRQFGTLATMGNNHLFPDTDTAMRHCEMLLVAEIVEADDRSEDAIPSAEGILDTFTTGELETVRRYAEECSFAAGCTVFEQGDRGDALYIVLEGMVDAVVNHDTTGRTIRVNTMTKGAVFGEMAILDPKPRSATIVAMEDTTCYRISASQFERLNAENPTFGMRMMKYLCLLFTNRLRLANLAIVELES